MRAPSELRIARVARPQSAGTMRHALDAFLAALEVAPDRRADVVVAVGEVLANAIEHGSGVGGGDVELYARIVSPDEIDVDVTDRGRFIEREGGTPGRGFGLRIVRAIARELAIDVAHGTRVHMRFDAPTATG